MRAGAEQGEALGGLDPDTRGGQYTRAAFWPSDSPVDTAQWATNPHCGAILQVAVDSLGADVGVLSLCNQHQVNGSILATLGPIDLLPSNVTALPASELIRDAQPMLFITSDAGAANGDEWTWIVIPLLVRHNGSGAVILLGHRGELHKDVTHASLVALGQVCTLALTNSLGQRAAELFEGLPEAAIVTDASGRITRMNRLAEHILGFARVDVVGEPMELLVPRHAVERFGVGRRQNGDLFIREVSDEDVRLREQEEFFLDVSHELRTPAATIKTSAEVLRDLLTPHLTVDSRQLLLNIEREADRLGALIDGLLDLNSIRSARVRLHAVRFDLCEVAVRVAETIEPLALQRSQTVRMVLPPTPVWAVTDPDLLYRAILNLVSNAQKYGKRGGYIEVRLESSEHQAEFAITDDGPGIPEADLDRVFQRFYRSPTAESRRIQGSGLGLPVCRAAVELLGGRVWADGGATLGSIFKVALPLQSESPAAKDSRM